MHEASLVYYENQQKMLWKVFHLKSINNEILHTMSIFLAHYALSISVSTASGIILLLIPAHTSDVTHTHTVA